MKNKIIVVTGGRGFIGSHFVEKALIRGHKVIDIDKMTYASNNKLPWDNHINYTLIKQDICDLVHLPSCDIVVNLAAESHVDNSIVDTTPFIRSNFLGVHRLLELIRKKDKLNRPVFYQVSTDEVYGDILEGSFKENDRLSPSNPYSAAKAAAEMLVLSYSRTYGIEHIITRSANNYGHRQYHEKLIPKSIYCLNNNEKIPLHGNGSYIRDWIFVEDNVAGMWKVIDSGIKNEIYNISANNHMTNLEVVNHILKWHNKTNSSIKFVRNRDGQDLRYSVDSSKLMSLGWNPKHTTGIYRWSNDE
tara:strand:+ start:1979 stop:2887 length:909 start_codon:yes stop_codon:yes gene_type:complete